MSFYATAKAGVNALTGSAQAEARDAGIPFTIFSPGFTATPMSAWTREAGVVPEEMVQPQDLGEALRFLLRTSRTCLVREIEFAPPTQREIIELLVAWRSRAAAGAQPYAAGRRAPSRTALSRHFVVRRAAVAVRSADGGARREHGRLAERAGRATADRSIVV